MDGDTSLDNDDDDVFIVEYDQPPSVISISSDEEAAGDDLDTEELLVDVSQAVIQWPNVLRALTHSNSGHGVVLPTAEDAATPEQIDTMSLPSPYDVFDSYIDEPSPLELEEWFITNGGMTARGDTQDRVESRNETSLSVPSPFWSTEYETEWFIGDVAEDVGFLDEELSLAASFNDSYMETDDWPEPIEIPEFEFDTTEFLRFIAWRNEHWNFEQYNAEVFTVPQLSEMVSAVAAVTVARQDINAGLAANLPQENGTRSYEVQIRPDGDIVVTEIHR